MERGKRIEGRIYIFEFKMGSAKSAMDQILEKIARLPNVVWAGVCTGRYDIIAEVVCVRGTEELYQFTTNTILKIGNVDRSETFILLKSRDNWICLPKDVAEI